MDRNDAIIQTEALIQVTATPGELDRKYFGIAYTPSVLAQYVADKAVDLFLQDKHKQIGSKGFNSFRILDPACGEGELLVAAWRALIARGITPEALALPRPSKLLCGVDVDSKAVNQTINRISNLGKSSRKLPNNVIATNSLCPKKTESTLNAWIKLKADFDAPEGFDIVIANPPWGADTSSYRDYLFKEEFKLLQGQFDTSDLFLELALKLVKANGLLAFIVPDSLFNKERTSLRKMLVEETQIRYIARLGEKFFDNINRACSIIICQKRSPLPDSAVECLRLTPKMRKQILSGETSFFDAEKALLHLVPQQRFSENRDYAFDIDLQLREEITMSKLRKQPRTIGDYLYSSRGVELSKNGIVCRCRHCNIYMPKPSSEKWKCSHCGGNIDTSSATTIVSEQKIKGYAPLLVGENIRRYAISDPMWIKINCDGIKYKEPSLYTGPKLLVRKTGVGISASIDYSNTLTNQVVYIFKPLSNCTLPLELFLAVMNSRAMYYFIAKQHGETEWRSHPYVTQSQILNLPFPNLDKISTKDPVIKEITSLVKAVTKQKRPLSNKHDARLESLVAKLFGLSKSDYKVVFKTLESIEGLLPVRALRNIAINDVFGVH